MQGSRKRSLSTLKSERGGHVIPANLETQDQAISAKFWGHQQNQKSTSLVNMEQCQTARPEYGTNGDCNHGFNYSKSLQIPCFPTRAPRCRQCNFGAVHLLFLTSAKEGGRSM